MPGQWEKGLETRMGETESVIGVEGPERVPGTRLVSQQGIVVDLGGPTFDDMAARLYARDLNIRGFGVPNGALVSFWKAADPEPDPPQANWSALGDLYLDWDNTEEGTQIWKCAVYDSGAVKLSEVSGFVLVQNGLAIPPP